MKSLVQHEDMNSNTQHSYTNNTNKQKPRHAHPTCIAALWGETGGSQRVLAASVAPRFSEKPCLKGTRLGGIWQDTCNLN